MSEATIAFATLALEKGLGVFLSIGVFLWIAFRLVPSMQEQCEKCRAQHAQLHTQCDNNLLALTRKGSDGKPVSA